MSNRADDCVLVIFGASGDLTRRKLLPAIYNLAEDGLLPEAFAIVGVARPRHRRGRLPRADARAGPDAEGEPLDAGEVEAHRGAAALRVGRVSRSSVCTSARRMLRELRLALRDPAELPLLLRDPARSLRHRRAISWPQSGLANEDDGWRRVIVEKPFGYDLESARALNARLTARIPRIADLPDRSLPRQRDRPEHPGVPVCQRDLRTDLEPALRLSRADDRRRRGRHRVARRLLRQGRGAARHRAEPHVPAADAGGDGAADLVQGGGCARREGQGAACGAVVDAGRRRSRRRARRSTRATGTKPTSRPTRAPRRSSRCGSSWTTGAGPASPSICAPARSWRAATPTWPCSSSARRSCSSATRPSNAPTRTCSMLRIQPDEGISLSFDAKVPGPLERLETVTMDFSYAGALQAGAVDRIRDAALRRDDWRPDALSSHGHGRSRLADRRAGPAPVGARHPLTGA